MLCHPYLSIVVSRITGRAASQGRRPLSDVAVWQPDSLPLAVVPHLRTGHVAAVVLVKLLCVSQDALRRYSRNQCCVPLLLGTACR